LRVGIIAEDYSDFAVLSEITAKLLRPRNIGFSRFVGHGCGKLRRKCGAWAVNLVQRGCPFIAVVHDLDDFHEASLRTELSRTIREANAKVSVVLIPRREIEAWLLYDAPAIAAAFAERRVPAVPGNPENVQDPKRFLRDLIKRVYGKEYLNTVHNGQIAKHIDPRRLKRSASFFPHFGFTERIKAILR